MAIMWNLIVSQKSFVQLLFSGFQWLKCDIDKSFSSFRQNNSNEQGAKKIIFKLAFTSPDVISTSPKSFFRSRIDLTVLLLFEFLKKRSLARRAS